MSSSYCHDYDVIALLLNDVIKRQDDHPLAPQHKRLLAMHRSRVMYAYYYLSFVKAIEQLILIILFYF